VAVPASVPPDLVMLGRKTAFWLGVAGVAVLANFLVELASDHVPSAGFKDLVAYTHRGPGR
jgi:hypothetical protein